MRIEVAGLTDVGMKRAHNEDNYVLLPQQRLFCVADGMGGHSCGEVASQIAVDEISEFFRLTGEDDELTWPYKMDRRRNYDENRLAMAIKLANLKILEHAATDAKYDKMGTTVVSAFFKDGVAYLAHVGDSRGYAFSGGKLRQVTEDHSLLNEMVKARKMTPEEIEAFPHKNVIVRALGMKDGVEVDVVREELRDGDVVLLCSDGLSGMLTDDEMEEILLKYPDLEEAAKVLIDRANDAGGVDNVTCILVRFHEN